MAQALHDIQGAVELFATPPEGFVAARNALAEELKSQGETEASTLIAKLKRPTGAVWAINQLARTQPEEIQRFLEIQTSLAEIGGGRRLNELASERRKVVARLTQLAGKLLKANGQTAGTQTLQRVGATLLAADGPEEQEAIRSGVLTHELKVSGFGGLSLSETTSENEDEADERERVEKELEDLEAAAASAAERATHLDEEAAELLQQADTAAAVAREARTDANRLAKEAKAARAKLERR